MPDRFFVAIAIGLAVLVAVAVWQFNSLARGEGLTASPALNTVGKPTFAVSPRTRP